MIVYKWINKIDLLFIILLYDMNLLFVFMRFFGEFFIIVIRSKNLKLYIIIFILFKIIFNNLDK